MSVTKLRFIIASISLACLGLLFVQFYWIRSAYDIKAETLKESLHQSLRQTVSELEKADFVHGVLREVRVNTDTLQVSANRKQNPRAVHSMLQSIDIGADSVTSQSDVKIVIQDNQSQVFVTQSQVRSDVSKMRGDLSRIEKQVQHWKKADSVHSSYSFQYKMNRDSLVATIVEAKPVDSLENVDVLGLLFNEDEKETINKKIQAFPFRLRQMTRRKEISITEADSVFAVQLAEHGFNIDDLDYTLELSGRSRVRNTGRNTFVLRSRLFPNDLFHSNQYLTLSVGDNSLIILKSLVLQILLSLFLIGIVITCFTIAIRTILQQKKLSELKNDFINNMTHELKTPISSIALAAEGLRQPRKAADTSRVSHYAKIITSENKRLATHVDNILQMAAIDRGQIELNIAELSIHEICTQTLERFSLSIEAIAGNAELALDAANDNVRGDRLHLANIFSNLIDNAVKYASGTPHLRFASWNEDENICISLEDNGIGMTKEQLRHVFEKFYRAQTGNIHDVKGFGLGLAYVKAMVDAHGGSIELESVLNKGTTVTLRLPLLV